MLQIKEMRANPVLDFAAQELKKYLRMMMPEAGDVAVSVEEGAKDGFRLGLLEDFGLSTEEVEDSLLDDVIHVETTEEGGVLAGSNPRSVLFAVYRFLRENGCRWLYPGVDGEHVPMQDIVPISYHKKADHRFRGHCNEGAESQTCMLETIDFYAKQELNVYMLEFSYPLCYYDSYYKHKHNEKFFNGSGSAKWKSPREASCSTIWVTAGLWNPLVFRLPTVGIRKQFLRKNSVSTWL